MAISLGSPAIDRRHARIALDHPPPEISPRKWAAGRVELAGMIDVPTTRRRWFQFRLRTLLALVTFAAVASWAYWIGWPWWLLHKEQARFLESVTNLKAGVLWKDVNLNCKTCGGGQFAIPEFRNKTIVMNCWPNVTYCVLIEVESAADGINETCTKIELFRLPPLSLDEHVPGNSRSPKYEYLRSFFLMIGGDRKDSGGFQYELIYSDPPK
jgi:hypothetical protein